MLGGCGTGEHQPALSDAPATAHPNATSDAAAGGEGAEGDAHGLGSVDSSAPPADELPIDELPVDARPEIDPDNLAEEPCPFLDDSFVETTNGQRVTSAGIDHRFATPACVFFSYPEYPQLQVMVRRMPSAEDATAVIDHAAPIDSTNPAEDIPGWSGGRAGGQLVSPPLGAIYAVANHDVAVVVLSNQEQSFKAEQVAREVIARLGG